MLGTDETAAPLTTQATGQEDCGNPHVFTSGISLGRQVGRASGPAGRAGRCCAMGVRIGFLGVQPGSRRGTRLRACLRPGWQTTFLQVNVIGLRYEVL